LGFRTGKRSFRNLKFGKLSHESCVLSLGSKQKTENKNSCYLCYSLLQCSIFGVWCSSVSPCLCVRSFWGVGWVLNTQKMFFCFFSLCYSVLSVVKLSLGLCVGIHVFSLFRCPIQKNLRPSASYSGGWDGF